MLSDRILSKMYHCAMCEYEASRKKSIRVHNGTKVFIKYHLKLYKVYDFKMYFRNFSQSKTEDLQNTYIHEFKNSNVTPDSF